MTAQSRTAVAAPVRDDGRAGHPWVVVSVIFLVLTLNMGAGFYALTAYTRFLVQDNGLSLGAASLGSTVFLLSSGLAGLALARMLARHAIRWVMVGGLLVNAAVLPFLGLATTGWQAAAVYLVLGLASCFWSMVPGTTLITQWFTGPSVARAMAIAATGLSVGGVAVLPVYNAVIDAVGLTKAALAMSVLLVVVLVPLIVLFMRPPHRPAAPDLATEIDAVAGETAATEAEEEGRHRGRDAQSRTYVFVVLCIGFGLAMASQTATVTHLLTLASERSIPQAPVAMSIMAFSAIVGRLAGIPILPRMGLWTFTVVMESLQAVAMAVIALSGSFGQLVMGLVLLGLTMGNNVLLVPLWVVEAFGASRYTRTYARLMFLSNFLIAGAPTFLGVLHDVVGSYRVPVLVMATGSAVSALLLATLREGRQSARPTAGAPASTSQSPSPVRPAEATR